MNRGSESAGAAAVARLPGPGERDVSLDDVRAPVRSADLKLVSGRRYEISAEADRDRLTVRGHGGAIVLEVEITARGPLLRFSGADVEIAATRTLRLSAEDVSVEAERDIRLRAGGSHHVVAGGDARLEASAVEIQASRRHVGLLARGKIALDGEHIGLNDDPAPAPFPWSEAARDPSNSESGE